MASYSDLSKEQTERAHQLVMLFIPSVNLPVLNFSFRLYTAHGKRFHCTFHHPELTVIIIIMLNLCGVLSIFTMLN